jgi:DNA-directed RNA polymerases I and III subunit RPAC2
MMSASVNDYQLPKLDSHLEVLEGGQPTSKTYIFSGEDHTLGNTLRHIIMQNPQTDFCGYSVPHPYEPKMNMRVQTYEGTTSDEVLMQGFTQLASGCDIIDDKFTAALKKFEKAGGSKETKRAKPKAVKKAQ